MAAVDEVLAALGAEEAEVDGLVAGLDEAGWARPTPAPGWTVAHQVAHLADSDRLARLAATDAAAFHREVAGLADGFDAAVDAKAADGAALPPDRLLAWWRDERHALAEAIAAVPAGARIPWLVAPVSAATLATTRLMEIFAHGQDIADALGARRAPAGLRHVAHFGVRTRDFAFVNRGLPVPAAEFRVELTGPDGELWTWGPDDAEQRVTGPAADFCLLVTQRRHRDDLRLRAEGPDAERWLGIAQAYAGPPRSGRAPGSVPGA
jgi:uncharacterized protein (TIGR03084 family)